MNRFKSNLKSKNNQNNYNGPMIIESYLKKKKDQSSGFVKKSKFTEAVNLRYFTLNINDGYILYKDFKENPEIKVVYNKKDLKGYETFIPPDEEVKCDFKFGFTIKTSSKNLYLYSETELIHSTWIRGLHYFFYKSDYLNTSSISNITLVNKSSEIKDEKEKFIFGYSVNKNILKKNVENIKYTELKDIKDNDSKNSSSHFSFIIEDEFNNSIISDIKDVNQFQNLEKEKEKENAFEDNINTNNKNNSKVKIRFLNNVHEGLEISNNKQSLTKENLIKMAKEKYENTPIVKAKPIKSTYKIKNNTNLLFDDLEQISNKNNEIYSNKGILVINHDTTIDLMNDFNTAVFNDIIDQNENYFMKKDYTHNNNEEIIKINNKSLDNINVNSNLKENVNDIKIEKEQYVPNTDNIIYKNVKNKVSEKEVYKKNIKANTNVNNNNVMYRNNKFSVVGFDFENQENKYDNQMDLNDVISSKIPPIKINSINEKDSVNNDKLKTNVKERKDKSKNDEFYNEILKDEVSGLGNNFDEMYIRKNNSNNLIYENQKANKSIEKDKSNKNNNKSNTNNIFNNNKVNYKQNQLSEYLDNDNEEDNIETIQIEGKLNNINNVFNIKETWIDENELNLKTNESENLEQKKKIDVNKHRLDYLLSQKMKATSQPKKKELKFDDDRMHIKIGVDNKNKINLENLHRGKIEDEIDKEKELEKSKEKGTKKYEIFKKSMRPIPHTNFIKKLGLDPKKIKFSADKNVDLLDEDPEEETDIKRVMEIIYNKQNHIQDTVKVNKTIVSNIDQSWTMIINAPEVLTTNNVDISNRLKFMEAYIDRINNQNGVYIGNEESKNNINLTSNLKSSRQNFGMSDRNFIENIENKSDTTHMTFTERNNGISNRMNNSSINNLGNSAETNFYNIQNKSNIENNQNHSSLQLKGNI